MHLHYVAQFSKGKVGHGSNLTGMALLVLALVMSFIKKAEYKRKVALCTFIFFAGLGYTSSAYSKLIASGPVGQ